MEGWFNPDSWMDIVSHVLLIIGGVLTISVPTWITVRANKNIQDVKEQVTNGHTSPMRLDLDRVLQRLEDLSHFILEVQRGVSGLRSDLVDEEIRRRENVRELREEIDRKLTELEIKIQREK
jgi:hypothetical protein